MTTFILKPRPPFRLDLAVWTLRRRFENAVDQWDGKTYRRVLPTVNEPILLEVTQIPGVGPPRLSVTIHGDRAVSDSQAVATVAVERLLGIRLDLGDFYDLAALEPLLGPLAQRFRGMKPPRFLTGFECLVNAIACQLFSLASGIQLLNRFAEGFGRAYRSEGILQFAFPSPSDLVRTEVGDLRKIGFSHAKAFALLKLAEQIRTGAFDFDSLRALSDQAAVSELCRLRGIGRWTAEYALLRGMGRLHVFPGDDVGAQNNLSRWLNLSEKLNYERVQQVLEQWRPVKGLVYFHLLLNKLAEAGNIQPASTAVPSKSDRLMTTLNTGEGHVRNKTEN